MGNSEWQGIDSHIHLDLYDAAAGVPWVEACESSGVSGLIAVSVNLASCKLNQALHRANPQLIHPAYGYHPERPLPSEEEQAALFRWMSDHRNEMVAVGEVGLPYYNRIEKEKNRETFQIEPYIELLEQFMQKAAQWNKPIILHAVYEDADIACDLLERYSISKTHFHWFKGSEKTVERMKRNGYFISFTPDIVYEQEIKTIAGQYPLTQCMIETDGPWPFEGVFAGQMTHPRMIRTVSQSLAKLKGLPEAEVGRMILQQTRQFYGI